MNVARLCLLLFTSTLLYGCVGQTSQTDGPGPAPAVYTESVLGFTLRPPAGWMKDHDLLFAGSSFEHMEANIIMRARDQVPMTREEFALIADTGNAARSMASGTTSTREELTVNGHPAIRFKSSKDGWEYATLNILYDDKAVYVMYGWRTGTASHQADIDAAINSIQPPAS